MYLEYDWTYGVYRSRFGSVWTAIRGVSSWDSLKDAKFDLDRAGLALGRKTDTRTWEIVPCAELTE